MLARFFKDESGATAIEYGLIAALVAVAIITALTLLGQNLRHVRRSGPDRRRRHRFLISFLPLRASGWRIAEGPIDFWWTVSTFQNLGVPKCLPASSAMSLALPPLSTA